MFRWRTSGATRSSRILLAKQTAARTSHNTPDITKHTKVFLITYSYRSHLLQLFTVRFWIHNFSKTITSTLIIFLRLSPRAKVGEKSVPVCSERSHKSEKLLFASSCLSDCLPACVSICLSVRMYKRGFHCSDKTRIGFRHGSVTKV